MNNVAVSYVSVAANVRGLQRVREVSWIHQQRYWVLGSKAVTVSFN